MAVPRESKLGKLLIFFRWLLKEALNFIKLLISFIVWLLWDFSGVRFVLEKIRPPDPLKKKRPPATFFLWVIGLYVASFGVASQRYENKLDRIENQTNATLTLIVKDESRKSAFRKIASVQSMRCPLQPNILKPTTIFKSLFGEDQTHDTSIQFLKGVIEDFKAQLSKADLRRANLERANLSGAYLIRAELSLANLQEANLSGADLSKTYLRKADLRGANLRGAILNGAILSRANLSGAILSGAILSGANLSGAILSRANLSGAILSRAELSLANLQEANLSGADLQRAQHLTIEQLSKVKTLYEAKLDPELMEKIEKDYPHLLEKPEPKR